MKQRKTPLTHELTKKGTPRKRAPGGGRPFAGRSVNLPRVSPETHQQLHDIAAALDCSLAEAVEHAARVAHKKLQN